MNENVIGKEAISVQEYLKGIEIKYFVDFKYQLKALPMMFPSEFGKDSVKAAHTIFQVLDFDTSVMVSRKLHSFGYSNEKELRKMLDHWAGIESEKAIEKKQGENNFMENGKRRYMSEKIVEKEGYYAINTVIDREYIDIVYKKKGERLFGEDEEFKGGKYDYRRVIGPYKTEREVIKGIDKIINEALEIDMMMGRTWGGPECDNLRGDNLGYLTERSKNIMYSEPNGVMELVNHNVVLDTRFRDLIGNMVRVDEIEKINVGGDNFKNTEVFKSVYVENTRDVFVLEVLHKNDPDKKVEIFKFNRDFDNKQVGVFLENYKQSRKNEPKKSRKESAAHDWMGR